MYKKNGFSFIKQWVNVHWLWMTVGMGGCLWGQENLAVNSDFEAGIDDWRGLKEVKRDQPDDAHTNPAPEFLTWEKLKAHDKSQGALQVTIRGSAGQPWHAHFTGTVCDLKQEHIISKGPQLHDAAGLLQT